MSVSNTTVAVKYTGNGSTVTPYSIPFPFLETSHIIAAVSSDGIVPAVLLDPSAYVVTKLPDGSGGTLTTVAAVTSPATIIIQRYLPLTQPTVFQPAGPFPAKSNETMGDRLLMQIQQINRRVNEIEGINDFDFIQPPTGGAVTQKDVQVFTSAVERAAALPQWTGQLGIQFDDKSLWVAKTQATGNWEEWRSRWQLKERIYAEGVAVPTLLTTKVVGFLSEATAFKRLFVASLGATTDEVQVTVKATVPGPVTTTIGTATIAAGIEWGEVTMSSVIAATVFAKGAKITADISATGATRTGLDITLEGRNT